MSSNKMKVGKVLCNFCVSDNYLEFPVTDTESVVDTEFLVKEFNCRFCKHDNTGYFHVETGKTFDSHSKGIYDQNKEDAEIEKHLKDQEKYYWKGSFQELLDRHHPNLNDCRDSVWLFLDFIEWLTDRYMDVDNFMDYDAFTEDMKENNHKDIRDVLVEYLQEKYDYQLPDGNEF